MSIAHYSNHNLRRIDDMASTVLKLGGIFLGLIFLLSLPSPLATAQEMEVIAGGELEYQNHCAVCHGVDASGNGIMSKYLTLPPANLTKLSNKYGGKFPFWQVYRTIDGREEVRGHGVSQMPVWGSRFRAESGGNDPGARSQAAGRILSLVFYLQHIQE
jgi:mono/diheme cytochrome c family protein